jgi:hypothetical protein
MQLINFLVKSHTLNWASCHQRSPLLSSSVITDCHQGVMTGFNPFVIRSPLFCHQVQAVVIMANPLLSVRIPPTLDELLKQKEADSGKSRSDVTIEALQAYLNPPPPGDEVGQLKRRLAIVEQRLGL